MEDCGERISCGPEEMDIFLFENSSQLILIYLLGCQKLPKYLATHQKVLELNGL